ncbi:MAG: hypothetical protein R3E58_01615 [Phycisphaerae bacterium]
MKHLHPLSIDIGADDVLRKLANGNQDLNARSRRVSTSSRCRSADAELSHRPSHKDPAATRSSFSTSSDAETLSGLAL